MRSPNLLTGDNVVSEEWCARALKHEVHLEKLEEHLAIHYRTHRLGGYFETLVHYWLAEVLHAPAVHANVQVQRGDRTLGEFDFLFEDQGQAMHWETAIKFYLYSDTRALFFGPAGNDRLDLKMNKIFEHQLQLSHQVEAAPIFERLGLHDVHSKAFVKGTLFYPRHTGWRTPPETTGVSKNHARGWWTHHGTQLLAQAHPETRWRILDKPEWLAGGDTTTPMLTRAQLVAVCDMHFSTSQLSLMVSELAADATGRMLEQSRGFITHKDWPFR